MTADQPPRAGGTAARRAARGETSGTSATAAATTTSSTASADDRRRSDLSVRRELDPDTLVALEEERDFLLRSLDDLEREHDAGDVDDPDYAELKDDYTARAAAVLRAIDDRRDLASAAGPGRSWVRTAVALGIVAVLAVGVGWFVFRDAGTRSPGDGITGDARQDSANLVLAAQTATGQARVALQDGDNEKALDLFRSALQSYTDALEISPGNVMALTYRGWLNHNLAVGVGEGPEAAQLDGYARDDLDQALANDPTFADALVFRAFLHADVGEFAPAQVLLDAIDPDAIPPYMADELASLQARVTAGLAGSS
jgi:tetratricopeptide (TPR) repeat protein